MRLTFLLSDCPCKIGWLGTRQNVQVTSGDLELERVDEHRERDRPDELAGNMKRQNN